MELKVARCPHCGARIKVNPELSVATCRYCQMQYDVEPAIHAFEMENEEGVTGNGQRVMHSHDVQEENNQKVIYVVLDKNADYQIYLDLRYELINKIDIEDNKIEYEFARDIRFDDPRLKDVENKILSVVEQEPNNEVLLRQEKKKWVEQASFLGLLD